MINRRIPKLSTLMCLILALLPDDALALTFSIRDRNPIAFPALVDQLANTLESTVNSAFPQQLENPFLKAMGTSSAAATRGMTTDPASGWNTMSLTAQVGAAVELPKQDGQNTKPAANALPALGLGAQSSVSLGLPARTLGLRGKLLGLESQRLRFYVNFMSLDAGQMLDDVRLKFATAGIHGQYQLALPRSALGLVRWNGLVASTGLQLSRLEVGYATPLNFSAAESGVTMTFNSVLDLGVSTNILTVPFDIATGVTLLSVLTPYAGLGLDLNGGSSKLKGGLTGPVVAKDGIGTTVFTGTAVLDATSPEGIAPHTITSRAFGGVQLNLWALRLFGQATFANPGTVQLLAGLRLAW